VKDASLPVVILGAGPAGLGAAYWLVRAGRQVIVLEKEPRVGGMGASQRVKDYIVDYGPHTFHLKKTPVTQLFERLAGSHVNKVLRDAKVWLHGKTLPFPLRMRDALTRLSPFLSSRMVLDFIFEQTLGHLRRGKGWQPASFEEWGVQQFGRTLYTLALGNYSEKMWGLPGGELSVKLARQKLVGLSLWDLVLAALGLLNRQRADAIGLTRENLYDAYPRHGIGTFFEALAQEVRDHGGQIELATVPQQVIVDGSGVTEVVCQGNGGTQSIPCAALVSSIPLPSLGPLLPAGRFAAAQAAAARLKYRSLNVVNLVLDKDSFSNAHWTYLLDPRLISNRLSEQKNLTEDSCPPGQTVVCLDITCSRGDYLWNAEPGFLIGLAMHDLSIMGLHPRTIIDAFVLRAADVYPIYYLGFERDMDAILDQLNGCANLFSIGRHGLLLNNDMHDSIEMGFLASQVLLEGKPARDWYEIAGRYVHDRLEGVVRDPIKFELTNGKDV
jgi:protoporphyrinogen oxidase